MIRTVEADHLIWQDAGMPNEAAHTPADPAGPARFSAEPTDEDIVGLFSPGYIQARQRFVHAATLRQLPVETHVHPLRGAEGEVLSMDVVRDGPVGAPSVLLLTSAVHGVEGHAGSALQTGLLTWLTLRDDTARMALAVVHVHAVNPMAFVSPAG